MSDFTVTVTRTKTIELTYEIDVTAKDEDSAINKATKEIEKAENSEEALEALGWEQQSEENTFDYEATEA